MSIEINQEPATVLEADAPIAFEVREVLDGTADPDGSFGQDSAG